MQAAEDTMSEQNSFFGTGQPGRALSFMDVFEFSADDLAANRSGTATAKQIARIGANRNKWQGQIVGIIGFVIILAAGLIFFTPRGQALREAFSQNPVGVGAVLGGVLLLWLGMIVFSFLRSRGMTNSKVRSIRGPFKLVGKPVQALDGVFYQRIKIGKQNFMIKTVQLDLFATDNNYTVYFTGSGMAAQIVSVEQA
jgi:hypothetical protein